MQQEDASDMTPKQKMKFDQLMKKLDGGKEHMKFKRTAKTPVQGDDMFHGYVKDLAMKEQTEIVEYTTVSPKMAKVFDSLKVGDTCRNTNLNDGGLVMVTKSLLEKKDASTQPTSGWDSNYFRKRMVYTFIKTPKTEVVLMICPW